MTNVWKIGLVLVLGAKDIPGWGSEGHRLIARIAAKHLSAQAQARASALLGAGSGSGALAAAMAEAARWADTIKGTPRGAGTEGWHFLDLAAGDGAAQITQRCPGNDCVTAQLRIMMANLKAGASLPHGSNTYSPGEQLKFVIHFMGDLHQPLHCATNADAGGNCLATRGFRERELHATWDTGLVNQLQEDGGGASESDMASALDSEFASQFAGIATVTSFDEMALESHAVAFQAAYGPMLHRGVLPGAEPRPFLKVEVSRCDTEAPDFYHINPPIDLTALYNAATVDSVRLQLAKAGYRLAAVLNGVWQ